MHIAELHCLSRQGTSFGHRYQCDVAEKQSNLQVPPTETELLKQQADASMLTHAEQLLAEQQDEAKAMNQMMLYSKCATIRDAQLEERKHMLLEEEEESRRLDMIMEIERMKALENYEERERQRKAERLIGAAVLLLASCLATCLMAAA